MEAEAEANVEAEVEAEVEADAEADAEAEAEAETMNIDAHLQEICVHYFRLARHPKLAEKTIF